MKIFLITISILFFSTFTFGQEVNIPVLVSDGISSDTLKFGLDPFATNGIDEILSEYELPPLPPAGIFEARFTGNSLNPPVPIGNGLKKDYREGSIGFTGQIKHRIRYQTGSGSTILISFYVLPVNMSIRIQDVITGSLIDTTINGPGSYLISNPLGFSSLYLTVNYTFTTAIENENAKNEIPEVLTLLQNYPNPFNPVTTISYYLRKNGNVKLTIYNSSGEQVRILNDSYQTIGFKEVDFYADNLATGMYYLELQMGVYSVTKRMLLLK